MTAKQSEIDAKAPPQGSSGAGASGDGLGSSELLIRRFSARAFGRGACAWLKDGIHDMAVVIVHDGATVVRIRGWTHGYPWTTCPGASAQLEVFLGVSIDGTVRPPNLDQGSQCTHLLDLARLAMAQAAQGGRTSYRLSVERLANDEGKMLAASANRDDEEILAWRVGDYILASPPELAGHRVDGRAIWPEALAADRAWLEAAMMLRRAIKMFRGRDRARKMTVDIPPAERDWMMGACYTFQPKVVLNAHRAAPAGPHGAQSPATDIS